MLALLEEGDIQPAFLSGSGPSSSGSSTHGSAVSSFGGSSEGPARELSGPAKRLRFSVGERDQWRGRPLSAAILDRLRHEGIAGATLHRGIAGYGASGAVHTTRVLPLSVDLRVVIGVVETAERMAAVLRDCAKW